MPDGLSASVLEGMPAIAVSKPVVASPAEKLRLYLWLGGLTCFLYFGSQRVLLFESRTLELSWFDNQIEFNPHWVWVYQTVYLVVPGMAFSLRYRAGLRRYRHAFYFLLALCVIPFIMYPVDGPVRDAPGEDWMYDFVRSYAGVRNCLPSLHVGMAALTIFFSTVVARERAMSPAATGLLVSLTAVWAAFLSYSTLAIKQHYAVDIVAGMLVAFIAFRVTSNEK